MMEEKEKLQKEIIELRKKIELVDKEISILFEKRMDLAKQIGEIKKELQLEIFDEARENYLINENTKNITKDEIKEYYKRLLQCMLNLSKEYQKRGK